MLRIRFILLLAASFGIMPPGADAFHFAPGVRSGMLKVTDMVLNLDVEGADAECQALLVSPQGEAVGRFCLGLVTLTRAEDSDEPAPYLDRFLTQVTDAIAAAERLEQSHPKDAEVKLLLGLAQGGKALADGARKNYLAAFQSMREAHRRFHEAVQLDPTLVDALYGIGLYNFALGRLPILVRPLVTIVLPRGDATQGLQEIERVAEQGTYLRMTARVALLRLYAGEEQKYAEALRLGRELIQRYPGNPDLYFAAAHAASELGRTPEALEIARRIARNQAEGRPHFTSDLTARYHQLLGKIYMDQGEYATALAFFQRAIEAPTPSRYRWVTAWAWTRSGMVHDLQGDREEAVRCYRKALAVETEGLAKDQARRYLDAPYRGRSHPAS
jgi:tetratricopeptide (TPR) repeat protein